MDQRKRVDAASHSKKFLDWCYLFVVGSVAGWCLEIAFRSVGNGALTIPGFLFGPYCPIYGFGIILIVALCKHQNKWIAYLNIFIYSSALEYIVSFLFETLFHELLWDYSMLPLSIGTRVSLAFSLIWGLLGMVVLLWVEPFLRRVRERHPRVAQMVAIGGIGIILLDTVLSVAVRLL